MASSSSFLDEQQQQQQQEREPLITTPTNEFVTFSVPTSPVLPGELLTRTDRENNLRHDMDELIRHFLSQFNRQHPYSGVFTWTINNLPHLQYNVIISITPSEDP